MQNTTKTILITEPIDSKGIDLLTSYGYQVRMGSGIDEATLLQEAKDCDGILTRNATLDATILDSCPSLKVISMHGVGVDCIDVAAATKQGIQVTNAAQANQSSVAEFTIGLMIMLGKQIPHYYNGLKHGN